ncbi:NUDIX hydrolase [Aspergillus tanneri]|uniref:Nudix hydrolase domain-containing protein n=1 Tax=Aspergillus tanneri TaxID=1220188 RepID=A0A5M9MGF8_9EURO|nr:uncharacterized protein ATNIH1004_007464 [Aspergillus tanneri]KAA8646041.1 hypothetical protein ATNIH1004_007464 [Aspergillus tanneri]
MATGSRHPSPPSSYVTNPALKSYDISVADYLSQNPCYRHGGIFSAAVIIYQGRVLLIQRASDDEFPDIWEVPGGTASQDETIIDCVVRELWEETGLRASAVERLTGEYECEINLTKWKIFIFLVVVDNDQMGDSDKIVLDPQEHQAFLWATRQEIEDNRCGEAQLGWFSLEQKGAILTALRVY